MRKRLSLVPYKIDPAPGQPAIEPIMHLQKSPTSAKPRRPHHRRHSSLVYKKTSHESPSKRFPRSPSSDSDELTADPEGFLDASLELHSEPGRGSFHQRRHNTIVSGNLERRESILRSIVRVENRERENREEMERRGVVDAPFNSVGLRKLSLQGRPARRRASMPSSIIDSPIAVHSALAVEDTMPPARPLGAAELLSNLEPQVTRETDISSAPTSLGLVGSRSSLLRPSSVSTSVATDEEPRVRFATPDDMRAIFRRQVHRESTLATLTGPPRSRPPVEILDHDHLAAMLSKQEYAATITPATTPATSVASASSLPRYRRRETAEAPAPDYVASAYTGDATAGIAEGSGFGHGEEEGPGAVATALGPTRRCTPLCAAAAATAGVHSAVRAAPSCQSSRTTRRPVHLSLLPGTAMSTRSTTSCLIPRLERRAQVSSRRWDAGSAPLTAPRAARSQRAERGGGASSSHRRPVGRRLHMARGARDIDTREREGQGSQGRRSRGYLAETIPRVHEIPA